MNEATLSTKNQVVVPREAREALQVKSGDKILFVVRGGRTVLLEKPKSPALAIRGLSRTKYKKDHLQQERESWE